MTHKMLRVNKKLNHELVYYDSVYITFSDKVGKTDKNGVFMVGKTDKS